MSHDNLSDYRQFRNVIKKLLLSCGLWPIVNANLLYRILPFPLILANVIVIIGSIYFIMIHITNVAAVTKGIGTTMSFITTTLKMIVIIVNRNDINEVHNTLDHHFKTLMNNHELMTSVLAKLRTFRLLSWVFIFFGTLTTLLILGTPLFSIVQQYRYSVDPIAYPLIYATAYFPPLNPPELRYQIHLFIELVASLPYHCVSISVDSLFMMYGFQMMAQFHEMSHRIRNIDQMTDDRISIQQCVVQHQSIMRCRDLLSKIFGPVILWLIVANAISLCTSAFQLNQIKIRNFSTLIRFALYIPFKLMQTFIYAYAGSCVTSESESYQDAIYNTNWHTNRRLMISILIMLTQKPLILAAYNFSIISLNIFIRVVNTTISYFFFLRTLS